MVVAYTNCEPSNEIFSTLNRKLTKMLLHLEEMKCETLFPKISEQLELELSGTMPDYN